MPSLTPCIINVDAIDLMRGSQMVVANLSLCVEPGSCLWLRGSNGSGKSTILLAIAGLLAPSRGSIKILKSPMHNKNKARTTHTHTTHTHTDIATLEQPEMHSSHLPPLVECERTHHITYMSSTPPLYGGLNSIQHWQLWQALFRKDPSDTTIASALTHWVSKPYARSYTLSRGQKQRLGLSALLCQRRSIWLLDEPFVHLDRPGCSLLIDAMKAHLYAQGSIVIASHGDMMEYSPAKQSCLHLKQRDPTH